MRGGQRRREETRAGRGRHLVVHVGVEDLGEEGDAWGLEGILLRDGDLQFEVSAWGEGEGGKGGEGRGREGRERRKSDSETFKGRVSRALDPSAPAEEVVVVGAPEEDVLPECRGERRREEGTDGRR